MKCGHTLHKFVMVFICWFGVLYSASMPSASPIPSVSEEMLATIKAKLADVELKAAAIQAKMPQNTTSLMNDMHAKLLNVKLAQLAPPMHIPLYSTAIPITSSEYYPGHMKYDGDGYASESISGHCTYQEINKVNVTVGLDAAVLGKCATMAGHSWLDSKIFAATEKHYVDKMLAAINDNAKEFDDIIKGIEDQQLSKLKLKFSKNKTTLNAFFKKHVFKGLFSLYRRDWSYLGPFFALATAQELALLGCNATINGSSYNGFTSVLKRLWLDPASASKPIDLYISGSDILGALAFTFGRSPMLQWSGAADMFIGMTLSGFSQTMFNSYFAMFAKRFLSLSYFLYKQNAFFMQHLQIAFSTDKAFAALVEKIRGYRAKEISDDEMRLYLKELVFKNKQAAWSKLKNRAFMGAEMLFPMGYFYYQMFPMLRASLGL